MGELSSNFTEYAFFFYSFPDKWEECPEVPICMDLLKPCLLVSNYPNRETHRLLPVDLDLDPYPDPFLLREQVTPSVQRVSVVDCSPWDSEIPLQTAFTPLPLK